MMGFNHIAGGFAFTGIFCSFNDVNVFEKPVYIACVAFFSLLPDVDHTRSLIGKAFRPFALYLDNNFGHRTITHSLLAILAVWLSVSAFIYFFAPNSPLPQICTFAFLSHIIFDMCTKQGVPFFYPFSNWRCVLPANPNLRLRSGDFKNEVIIFFVFCCLNLFSINLIADGFWTTYNKAFSTFEHLQREERREKNLLKVKLKNRKSDSFFTGFLMKSGKDEIVLFDSVFLVANSGLWKIEEITRTEKRLRIESKGFEEIEFDELLKFEKLAVSEIKIRSNSDFFDLSEGFRKTTKSANFKNLIKFPIEQTGARNESLIEKLSDKKAKLKSEKLKQELKLSGIRKAKSEIKRLRNGYSSFSSYEKGKALKKIDKLESKVEMFELSENNFESLEIEISEIESQLKELQKFSGSVSYFVF